MNSQSKGTKLKQLEESTQNTYEASRLAKEVITRSGEFSYCEALSDRI